MNIFFKERYLAIRFFGVCFAVIAISLTFFYETFLFFGTEYRNILIYAIFISLFGLSIFFLEWSKRIRKKDDKERKR